MRVLVWVWWFVLIDCLGWGGFGIWLGWVWDLGFGCYTRVGGI